MRAVATSLAADWPENRPGYRRAVRVEPAPGAVVAMLEDDLHAMAVRLLHDGAVVSAIEVVAERMPWSPCPGAVDMLRQTFTGVPLAQVTARRAKQANCTHLHDLAVLAASHAADAAPAEWRIAVSDPVAGERVMEISRDGVLRHRWAEQGGVLVAPPELAGQQVLTLRDWIASLEPEPREAARLLQWGALVAHGRSMDDAGRHAALGVRPSCYTMQPERVAGASKRSGMHEFTGREERLLEGLKATLANSSPARGGGPPQAVEECNR